MTFIVVIWAANIIFDKIWDSTCFIPVSNLHDVYKIPENYDNQSKINLKLEDKNKLIIEGNKKFKLAENSKSYDYYDTIKITKPDTSFSVLNKIYIKFENSGKTDSIYFVVSKSPEENIFWNQIFYSSVKVESLNKLSNEPGQFRIRNEGLASGNLLENNDSLINEAIRYFNINKDNLGLAECGTNSGIFKSICDKFGVPARTISLQGGDASDAGYDYRIGYPLHVVCEIYSSRFKKWYVIDPSYGNIYTQDKEPLNAVEISNKVFFSRESSISQDSVLVTRTNILDKDYFKYYENVFFHSNANPNRLEQKFLQYFYGRYHYQMMIYSHSMPLSINKREYLLLKSIMYFLIILVNINIIYFIFVHRLLVAKRPVKQ